MLIKLALLAFTIVQPAAMVILRSVPLVQLVFTFRVVLVSMLAPLSAADTALSAHIMAI